MTRIMMGAFALMLTAGAVSAGGEIATYAWPPVTPDRNYDGGIIDRATAIEGCMELVEEIKTTGEVPDFFARHKEYFRDLKRQLKKENFPNWQELMMGSAIKICMREKGWVNKCVSDTGREGDLQTLETARIPTCWTTGRVATAPPPEPPQPPQAQPRPEPQPPERPVYIPPPEPVPPPMSPADLRQYQEDLAIVSQQVTIIGDDEGGRKVTRLASCVEYWQAELHHRRQPEVRQILLAVRIWRCMFRTHYTIMSARCPNTANAAVIGWGDGSRGTAISGTRNPYCYARFAG